VARARRDYSAERARRKQALIDKGVEPRYASRAVRGHTKANEPALATVRAEAKRTGKAPVEIIRADPRRRAPTTKRAGPRLPAGDVTNYAGGTVLDTNSQRAALRLLKAAAKANKKVVVIGIRTDPATGKKTGAPVGGRGPGGGAREISARDIFELLDLVGWDEDDGLFDGIDDIGGDYGEGPVTRVFITVIGGF
jgi:hypothetical protein